MEDKPRDNKGTGRKDNSKAVTVTTPSNLDVQVQFNTQNELWAFAERIVKSKKFLNIESPEALVQIMVKAKELGIGWANLIDHMFDISGKNGVDYHVLVALARKPGANLIWTTIEDRIVYDYYGLRGGDPVVLYNDEVEPLPSIFEVYESAHPNKEQVKLDIAGKGKIAVIRKPQVLFDFTDKIGGNEIQRFIYNKITKVEFKRTIFLQDGTKEETRNIGSFTNREAFEANLFFKSDGTVARDKGWIRYNDNQRYIRAWTQGGRRTASDLFLGLYETSELLDVAKVDYVTISENEHVFTKAEVVK